MGESVTGKPIHRMTVSELASAIRRGDLSPTSVTEAFIERIEQLDPSIRAWVSTSRADALEASQRLTREAKQGHFRGPLHGIPVGVKDVYDVAGMVTTCGAPAFAHSRPEKDARSIAFLRQAGAVIIGKTVTTEFALTDPAETRNPWNLDHTPGGSSSGSGAAVAAHMVPAALGTQSLGSVLRPAAYCGLVGFKPTHGRISFQGVAPVAPTVDHVGFLTKSVAEARLLLTVLGAYDSEDPLSADMPPALEEAAKARPRLGIPTEYLSRATPEMASHTRSVLDTLATAGAHVEEVTLPPSFEDMYQRGREIMLAELAAHHQPMFSKHSSEYKPRIREAIEDGARLSASQLVRAQAHRSLFRRQISLVLERYDALLTPACPAAAPKGLVSTGDGSFFAPWTFAGFPTIAVPSGISSERLPLGIQLISAYWRDAGLLSLAGWCQHLLPSVECPI